jgi:hypothetical protein
MSEQIAVRTFLPVPTTQNVGISYCKTYPGAALKDQLHCKTCLDVALKDLLHCKTCLGVALKDLCVAKHA